MSAILNVRAVTAPVLLRRPLAIAALAFLGGILAGSISLPGALALFCSAAALSGWALRRRSPFALLSLPICYFTAGLAARALTLVDRDPDLPIEPGREIVIQGTVIGAPERAVEEDRFELDLEAFAMTPREPMQPARGRIRVMTPRTTAEVCGEAGDRMRVLAKIFPRERAKDELEPREAPIAFASASSDHGCVRITDRARGNPSSVMERQRSRIHEAIARHLDGEHEAIVRAFATGNRSGIPRAVADDFQAAGLSHLLAVSGLNLAIIAGLFVVLLAAIFRRVPRVALDLGASRLAAIPAVPFVVAYTLLVGASASAVRAAIMVIVLLIAQIAGRLREPISALGLALLIMLALDPGAIADVSLLLSFAAVLALFYLYPVLARPFRLESKPLIARVPVQVALASFVAALATAPIAAHHFQQLSLIGVFANIPAHPLASFVLVPLALLGGLLGLVSGALAHPVLWIAGHAAEGLQMIAHHAARVPGGTIALFSPTVLESLLFAAILIAIVAAKKRIAIACALLLALEVGAIELERRTDANLRVTVLAVGQGDAIVVELPRGRTLVVDTGPSAGPERRPTTERVLIPFLASRRIHRIDRLIITHPHSDHAGGLTELSRRVPIEELWWTGDRREGTHEAIAELADLKTSTIAGEELNGVALEVLGPLEAKPKKVNDGSIVLRLRYKQRSILLAGDAEKAEEQAMLKRCSSCLRADVLKLGHHGSNTSSSEQFLDAVAPKAAIASLGRGNRFGFPHRAVTDRLARRGIELYRTDRDGAVTIETDGESLSVTAERR